MNTSWRVAALFVLPALAVMQDATSAQRRPGTPIRGVVLMQVAIPREQQKEGTSADDQFTLHARRAQSFLSANKPEEAIPELEAASVISPDHVEIEADLGVLLFYAGRLQETIPHLKRAIALRSDLFRVQALLGIAEARVGSMQAARDDLSAALPRIDSTAVKLEAGLELVSLDTLNGQLDEAAGVLPELRRIGPADTRVLFAAYNTYADLARESILALALAAPDSAQLQQAISHELIREGKPAEAIAHYKQALRIDPHIPGGHFELAEVLAQSSDEATKREAETEYDKALADNPKDGKALWREGQIAAKRGDDQKALQLFQSAIALQPADFEARFDLAKTLIHLGRNEEALRVLEESEKSEPTSANVHYRLAALYRRAGRTQDAEREVNLYKHYRQLKDKLRATLQELMMDPESDLRDTEVEQP